MASFIGEKQKPILFFSPVIVTIGLDTSNSSISKLHTQLSAECKSGNITEKMKAIALINFAQYPEVFDEKMTVSVCEGPNGRKVVVMNASFSNLTVVFHESSESIISKRPDEESKFIYQGASTSLVIYSDRFLGKILFIWTQAMIDIF